MSKHIVARRDRAMRFVVSTGSGHEIVVDNAAGDAGPRPTELVLVGLAACTGMDVIGILEKKRLEVTDYRVDVVGVQREERPDVFVRVDIVHEVAGPAVTEAAVRRAIELSAWKYCPVSAMLCAGTVEVHHRYRIDHGDGTAPMEGEVLVLGPGFRPGDAPLTAGS